MSERVRREYPRIAVLCNVFQEVHMPAKTHYRREAACKTYIMELLLCKGCTGLAGYSQQMIHTSRHGFIYVYLERRRAATLRVVVEVWIQLRVEPCW